MRKHADSEKHDLHLPTVRPFMDQANRYAPGAVPKLQTAELGRRGGRVAKGQAKEKGGKMSVDEARLKKAIALLEAHEEAFGRTACEYIAAKRQLSELVAKREFLALDIQAASERKEKLAAELSRFGLEPKD